MEFTPMKTRVDNVHFHLIAKKKSTLNERAMVQLSGRDHIRQHGKQRVGSTSFAIIAFMVSINLYKYGDEAKKIYGGPCALHLQRIHPFFNM
jgi:hypothetical protein